MPDFIYLASQSPRRRQLLEQLGVHNELLLPNVDGDIAEDAEGIEAVLPGESWPGLKAAGLATRAFWGTNVALPCPTSTEATTSPVRASRV